MDKHLTNGGRAIPKLIVEEADSGKFLGSWGPRPLVLANLMKQWKDENQLFEVVLENLHSWYAKDKTVHTQLELLDFFKGISSNH